MPNPWSDIEVELIVSDYFQMLAEELSGKPINKAMHRRALMSLLNNRTEGSVEFKHQNISAVLITLGQPYIKGYLPRFNYQTILEDFVIDYLTKDLKIENCFREFSTKDVKEPQINFQESRFLIDPPLLNETKEPVVPFVRRPIKTNYLQVEQNNQKLGKSGEEVVIKYEKWSLASAGYGNLADKVEWVSQDQGDGAGFDILSRNHDGSDKYIEVKTTKLGKEAPFYFTRNELAFSLEHKERYNLYRLFNFDRQPNMFIKQGDFNSICRSVPVMFKGYF